MAGLRGAGTGQEGMGESGGWLSGGALREGGRYGVVRGRAPGWGAPGRGRGHRRFSFVRGAPGGRMGSGSRSAALEGEVSVAGFRGGGSRGGFWCGFFLDSWGGGVPEGWGPGGLARRDVQGGRLRERGSSLGLGFRGGGSGTTRSVPRRGTRLARVTALLPRRHPEGRASL